MPFTILKRMCDLPVPGGTYIYVPPKETASLKENPFMKWVICEPYQVPDPEGWGMSKIGITPIPKPSKLFPGEEVYDLWDWIGLYWLNAADYIVESMHLGLHAKINPALARFVSVETNYVGVHPRGYTADAEELFKLRLRTDYGDCPQGHKIHSERDYGKEGQYCAGLHWNVIEGGKTLDGRMVKRELASMSYEGYSPPPGWKGTWTPAAIIVVPIGRLGNFLVYEDTQSQSHKTALEKLGDLNKLAVATHLMKLQEGDNNGS